MHAAHSEELSTAESRLVRDVLARDRKATAEFVAAYTDPVYAYIRRRLFPRDDLVEDIVQDVFLEALRGLHRYRGESPLGAWIMAIARHKVQDHYRNCLRDFNLDDTAEPVAPGSPDASFEHKQRTAQVAQTLAVLPEPYRYLLLWRYWERATASDMAARLGKTEKAIERMLARAREHFRRHWPDSGGAE